MVVNTDQYINFLLPYDLASQKQENQGSPCKLLSRDVISSFLFSFFFCDFTWFRHCMRYHSSAVPYAFKNDQQTECVSTALWPPIFSETVSCAGRLASGMCVSHHYCSKCVNHAGNHVHLCIQKGRSCFQVYHSAEYQPQDLVEGSKVGNRLSVTHRLETPCDACLSLTFSKNLVNISSS